MKQVQEKGETPRNYLIDALRFVAICFVVYIHIFEINKGVSFSDDASWKLIDVLFGLARLAVPIFFAISGWFIFSRDRGEQIKKLQKQIPKLITILIVATIGINIVLFFFDKLHLMNSAFEIAPNIKALVEMFVLGKSPTIGTLWFLSTLIIVQIIYWLASRTFKKDNWLMVAAFAFFSLNLAFGAYRNISGFPELSFPINETWFVGFAWFSLGYFLAKFFKDKPELIKTKTLALFTVTVGAFYLYEYILHTSGAAFNFGPYNYHAIFLFTPLITAGILLLAARSNMNHPILQQLAYLGKNYALGVFIIHLVVMQPVNAVFVRFDLLDDRPLLKLVIVYTSVVVLSFAATAFYYKAKAFVSSIPALKTLVNKS